MRSEQGQKKGRSIGPDPKVSISSPGNIMRARIPRPETVNSLIEMAKAKGDRNLQIFL